MKRTTIVITDDLDGSPGAGTYTVGIGGRWFELDLTREHHAELCAALAPYLAVARPVTGARKRTPASHAIVDHRTVLAAQQAPVVPVYDARPRTRRQRAVG